MERITLNSLNNYLIIFSHESDESMHDKIKDKIDQQSEQSVEGKQGTGMNKGVNAINATCQDEEVIPPDTGIIELLDDSSEEKNINELNEGMTKNKQNLVKYAICNNNIDPYSINCIIRL